MGRDSGQELYALVQIAGAICEKNREERKDSRSPIDRTAFLTKILSNGECGCRGEDGDQSRLNVSANLERPVQNRPFGFLNAD